MSSRNAQCAPLQTTKVKVREDDLPTENRALRLTPPVIVDGDGDRWYWFQVEAHLQVVMTSDYPVQPRLPKKRGTKNFWIVDCCRFT